MHFFNPRIVAQKLRDDTFSERDKFSYLIASITIRVFSDFPSRMIASRDTPLSAFLGSILIIVIYLVGLRVCFATNARGDNQRFIERWLCLSPAILIWTSLLPSSLAFIAYLLYPSIKPAYSGLYSLFLLFLGALMMLGLILYFVLLNHFIFVASGSRSNDDSNVAPIAAP